MTTLTKQLKAQDIMVAEPVCVEPSITIRQLARMFEENEISGAPVIDKHGRVIGVVSKTDLIRRCSEGRIDVAPAYLFEAMADRGAPDDDEVIPEAIICVEDFMTTDPITVGPNVPAGHVARLMFERRIHRVIVVNHDRFPIGIITSLDLLGVFPA